MSETAESDNFEQARERFLKGLADLEAGRLAEAESLFESSLELLPGRVSTLVNLAATRILLGRANDALPLIDQALGTEPDAAEAWWQRGLALGELQRFGESLQAFERVLALQPSNAAAWFRHGQALEYLEQPAQALVSFDRALALDDTMAEGWTQRGNALKELGRPDEAADAYRRAIECGGDERLNRYYVAALTGDETPATAPREYVRALFDTYAEGFDEHLVNTLRYRAHERLIAPLKALHFRSALDLGCGTGLCGPLLRPLTDRLAAVDLSAVMLERARALGVYDELVQADLVEFLRQTQSRHDLVLAADVFIYLGALEAVFEGVRRLLDAGGMFCFSVEHAPDKVDYELRPSLRYAHSARYLRTLAATHGFEVLRLDEDAIREDQRVPVDGLYAWMSPR